MSESSVSSKKVVPSLLLLTLMGGLGAHRFYLGKTQSATVMLICTLVAMINLYLGFSANLAGDADTAAICEGVGFLVWLAVTLWQTVDFISLVAGCFKDSQGLVVETWL